MCLLRQAVPLLMAGLVIAAPMVYVQFCELQDQITHPRRSRAEMAHLHPLSLSLSPVGSTLLAESLPAIGIAAMVVLRLVLLRAPECAPQRSPKEEVAVFNPSCGIALTTSLTRSTHDER